MLYHKNPTPAPIRAAPNTVKRVKEAQNIELVLEPTPEEVYGDNMGVTGLKVALKDGSTKDLKVPGVFIFVGNDINNQILIQEDGISLCELNKQGQVIVDLNMKTSLPGLFAAGDMRLNSPKQVVCAAGDGAVAAISATYYVDELQD